jgi:hypothetical protein
VRVCYCGGGSEWLRRPPQQVHRATAHSPCCYTAAALTGPLAGERSVWDYWFAHFTPQYAGLPGLGSLERIYNQVDVSAELYAVWCAVC